MLTSTTLSAPARPEALTELADLLPLLRELNDLKRGRVAGREGSLTEQLFARAWAALVAGHNPTTVALRETAWALTGLRLPGYDEPLLTSLDLTPAEATQTLHSALRDAAKPLAEELIASVTQGADFQTTSLAAPLPAFVGQLAQQPRAGATHPGQPRIMLWPPESHADHCALVAVYGVLLSPTFGADPGEAFLTGLAHHLHNAALPDPGYAGDELLGTRLPGLMARATAQALEQLPEGVRPVVTAALDRTRVVDAPAARAFHAADVFDRVLEMAWHDQSAQFRLHQALGDLNIVHAGFTQQFHQQVLTAAGLLPVT
ncbi:HD domain-containing protein [Hymenobacter volaticus]|uniref:HD domain-containing protein n=1 Tax=Hymenobacter volaticus TaxID=2932254 RepID=A0ABY4GG86_9BACT|nr:HD domain-containing protein [Hymenobacter volaticus]UOQ69682.1 HD domain-containing protein [Hymenobacter volaticus]